MREIKADSANCIFFIGFRGGKFIVSHDYKLPLWVPQHRPKLELSEASCLMAGKQALNPFGL